MIVTKEQQEAMLDSYIRLKHNQAEVTGFADGMTSMLDFIAKTLPEPAMEVEDVFTEIQNERTRQDNKWGEQNHSPANWLMILGEEVGEVNKAALEAKFGNKTLTEYREELIQVAAVAVAMIQCYDRNTPPTP